MHGLFFPINIVHFCSNINSHCFIAKSIHQRAKKVVSDSPGLVDFAIGLVNSVFNLPDGQVIVF